MSNYCYLYRCLDDCNADYFGQKGKTAKFEFSSELKRVAGVKKKAVARKKKKNSSCYL